MKRHGYWRFAACALLALVIGAGCSSSRGPTPQVGTYQGHAVSGIASWYGPGFHGKRTASGERFNQDAMTAAHRTLPFGTIVRVTNERNNRVVEVRINDRGPFVKGRVIDVSREAARQLDMMQAGIVPCRVDIVAWGQ